ncbi:unnamed protein product, partial [Urochloa humidicola]
AAETRWRRREVRRCDAELAAQGRRVAARGNGVAAPHILDGDGDSDHLRRLLAGAVKARLGSAHRQFTSSIEV